MLDLRETPWMLPVCRRVQNSCLHAALHCIELGGLLHRGKPRQSLERGQDLGDPRRPAGELFSVRDLRGCHCRSGVSIDAPARASLLFGAVRSGGVVCLCSLSSASFFVLVVDAVRAGGAMWFDRRLVAHPAFTFLPPLSSLVCMCVGACIFVLRLGVFRGRRGVFRTGGALWPDVLRRRADEVHLRYRELHPHEHGGEGETGVCLTVYPVSITRVPHRQSCEGDVFAFVLRQLLYSVCDGNE